MIPNAHKLAGLRSARLFTVFTSFLFFSLFVKNTVIGLQNQVVI